MIDGLMSDRAARWIAGPAPLENIEAVRNAAGEMVGAMNRLREAGEREPRRF